MWTWKEIFYHYTLTSIGGSPSKGLSRKHWPWSRKTQRESWRCHFSAQWPACHVPSLIFSFLRCKTEVTTLSGKSPDASKKWDTTWGNLFVKTIKQYTNVRYIFFGGLRKSLLIKPGSSRHILIFWKLILLRLKKHLALCVSVQNWKANALWLTNSCITLKKTELK